MDYRVADIRVRSRHHGAHVRNTGIARRLRVMVCSCCDFERTVDRQFTEIKAAKELRAYRNGRVGPTTRRLRDAIVDAALNGGSLLDIGAGVGALTFELLDRGITGATVVEASTAYAAAVREEANRRGMTHSVRIVPGDLLDTVVTLPSASLVTLDRVVCCYPLYEPMLESALRLAEHGFALSYPQDRWYVRTIMRFENMRRARKSGFRTFVHPPTRIGQIIHQGGFELIVRRRSLFWTIDVFVRRATTAVDAPI